MVFTMPRKSHSSINMKKTLGQGVFLKSKNKNQQVIHLIYKGARKEGAP